MRLDWRLNEVKVPRFRAYFKNDLYEFAAHDPRLLREQEKLEQEKKEKEKLEQEKKDKENRAARRLKDGKSMGKSNPKENKDRKRKPSPESPSALPIPEVREVNDDLGRRIKEDEQVEQE